jgi:predicted phage terminase large subunit-like protein
MPFDFPLEDYSETISLPVLGERFVPLHHVRLIINKLEQVFCGCLPDGKKNLIINIPPRHGKTWIVRLFISWGFGLSPRSKFIYTSYSDDLATETSTEVKKIINSQEYQDLFPWVNIDRNRQDRGDRWYTTQGGGMLSKPSKGQITGFGAGQLWAGFHGAIIIDDPMKPGDARSNAIRQSIINWYNGTLINRKNHRDVPMIIIMQRLHPNDLCGYIKKNELKTWDILSLPFVNDDGSYLWPERIDESQIEVLKEVDPFTYHSQYLQSPIMPGGNMLKNSWWKAWTQADLNRCTGVFLAADTAFKKTKTSDYSAISVFAYSPDALLLIDQVHGKWEWPELVKNAKEMHKKYSPTKANELPMGPFIIEDKASGTSLIQQLGSIDGINVKMWSPKGRDKVFWVRDMLTPLFSGLIKRPESAPWLDNFLDESSAFTEDDSHDHDDRLNTVWIAHDAWRNYANYL